MEHFPCLPQPSTSLTYLLQSQSSSSTSSLTTPLSLRSSSFVNMQEEKNQMISMSNLEQENDDDGFKPSKFAFSKSFRNVLLTRDERNHNHSQITKNNISNQKIEEKKRKTNIQNPFHVLTTNPKTITTQVSSSQSTLSSFSFFHDQTQKKKRKKEKETTNNTKEKEKKITHEFLLTDGLSQEEEEGEGEGEEEKIQEKNEEMEKHNENPPVEIQMYSREVQVCSDIHLDYHDIREIDFSNIVKPCAPILVIAGDVGNPKTPLFHSFVDHCCTRFLNVIFIAGNHEYHRNGSIASTNEVIKNYETLFPNFHFLHNSSIELNGLYFVGSTLWTHIPTNFPQEELLKIKDYRKIYKFTSQLCNQMHAESTTFLKEEINKAQQNNRNIIIITHHAPLLECIEEQFEDDPLRVCFVSNQMKLFAHPNVLGWIYGHTHYNYKREEGQNNIQAFLYANCYRISQLPYNPMGCPF